MTTKHNNEPRDVGYSESFLDYYRINLTITGLKRSLHQYLQGKTKKILFIFAMAIG